MQAQFDRKARERSGLSPEQQPSPNEHDLFNPSDSIDPVVQIVLSNQYEDFGFPVYRVNYANETQWATWYERFDELLEASLEEAAGGERIKERHIIYKVEDSEMLDRKPFRAVQE